MLLEDRVCPEIGGNAGLSHNTGVWVCVFVSACESMRDRTTRRRSHTHTPTYNGCAIFLRSDRLDTVVVPAHQVDPVAGLRLHWATT